MARKSYPVTWLDVAVGLFSGFLLGESPFTPHATGPNRSEQVRKSYIVQFAPIGAEVLSRNRTGAIDRECVDRRSHTFPILVDGD